MAESFTARHGKTIAPAHSAKRRRVLVTGAAGNIGSFFATHSHQKYTLRLMVHRVEPALRRKLGKCGEILEADLGDLDAMRRACEGIDTVVHMAGDPSPSATWDSLLQANIIGAYNTFVAAKAAGCRRVIYASSIHAVSGYPADVQVKTSEPVNPGDLYGVSKCFGEAMARYMATQEGLSTIVLRIGAFQPRSAATSAGSIGMLDAWISQRDMNQLIEKCIDIETLQFAILNALSDNRFKRLDITDARELVGYAPQDDLTALNPRLKKLRLRKQVASHNLTDARQISGLRRQLKPKRGQSSR